MFKSVFHRLLVTFLGIFAGIMLLMTVFMSLVFNNHLIQQKQSQMLTVANQVQTLFQLRNSNGPQQWQGALNILAQATDNRIYVYTGPNPQSLRPLTNSPLDLANNAQIQGFLARIFQGETINKRKYLNQTQRDVLLFTGIPLRTGNSVNGAILILSPVSRLRPPVRLIWLITLVSLLLAAGVIYFVSRRLSRPVEIMQKAAAAIAEGHFDSRVDIPGQDEIAQLAASFNFMQNRLQQIEEMRKDLIANVSHELRTPLTTIRGFIQAILEKVIGPEDQDKYLQRAYEETNRLTRLVTDLLQLARLHAGTIKTEKSPVDISGLIHETVEENRLLASQKEITLQADLPASALTATVDRDKLKQVILNLIHNALNYTPAGGSVLIHARRNAEKLVIRVKDTGPGIPPEQLEFIFLKFHRGENRTPGTGLGLSIAKELVELHGGKIYALSTAGQGTEMVVELYG